MPKAPLLFEDTVPISPPDISILDVGALPTGEPVYAPLLSRDGTSVVGFEPQARSLLIEKYGTKYVWLDDMLGDGRDHTFYQTEFPGCSSLFKPNDSLISMFAGMNVHEGGNFHVTNSVPVSTTKLNDIAAVGAIDFAKIDVQGSELMILEHGMEKLRDAVVLEVEAAFLPLYHNQPLFADLHTYLKTYGFELHKFVDVTGRAIGPFAPPNPHHPVSQLIEADAIFVRHLTTPESLSQSQLIKAAHILHDLYCSYDLAYFLLQAYDKAAVVPVADAYMDAIKNTSERLELKFLNIKMEQ